MSLSREVGASTVAYEQTVEDVVAFNLHYLQSSPLPQKNLLLARASLTALLASLLLALGLYARAPIPFWLLGALILLAWFRLFPSRAASLLRRHTERLYREKPDRGLLGPHEVTLEPDWLVERTDWRESRTHWRVVESVVTADGHLFLYVTPFSAVIVPRRAFDDERAFRAFAERAESLRASHAAQAMRGQGRSVETSPTTR